MPKENIDVLIVDDDQDICLMVSSILKFSGIHTQQTSVIEKLDDLLVDYHPKLLLMDMLLSGKDGRDVCRRLKAGAQTAHMPIIMMSAHPDAEQSCRAVGANDFIGKPFDIDVFIEKIKRWIK